MATETASPPKNAASTVRPSRPRRPKPPQWQLPIFLVGLAALWGMWNHGERLRPTLFEQFQRVLLTLRPAVEKVPVDVDLIQAALRKIPASEPPPELAPQIRYLAGSAYVVLAETTTSTSEAEEYWPKAREYLELAAEDDLPEAERKKLRFRLARTWAHTPGVEPKKIIETLTQFIACGDDPAEGHRLLAEQFLKLNPPNEKKARDAMRDFLRHASTRSDARTINGMRVRLAELHESQNESEESRKVLERVGPEAPPEILAKARLMLAKHYQADEDWTKMAKILEQVRDMKGALESQRTQALSGLGDAYARLNRPDDAAHVIELIGRATGPESYGAALKLAEVKLHDPNASLDSAVTAIEQALVAVKSPKDYPASSIPLTDARKICREAIDKARTQNDYPLAARACKVFAKLCDDSTALELTAANERAWGESLAMQPDAARPHFRAAADAIALAAEFKTNPVEKGDFLRQAASLHRQGDDLPKAISVLTDLTTRVPDYPEDKAGLAWADIGDLHAKAGDKIQARDAYRNAAARKGPAEARSKLRFAVMHYESDPSKGPAGVIPLVEDVVNSPDVASGDKEAHEEASFTLADWYFGQKEWSKAEGRLRSALEAYPESPRAIKGKLQFGQCFWFRAIAESNKIKVERVAITKLKEERIALKQPNYKVEEQLKIEEKLDRMWDRYQELLKQAIEPIRQAEKAMLETPGSDPELLRRASFLAADCAFWMGDYPEAATRYGAIATRYRGKAEELEAIRNHHLACKQAADLTREPDVRKEWTTKATLAAARLKEALLAMPDMELDGSMDVRKRAYWDKWLEENGVRK